MRCFVFQLFCTLCVLCCALKGDSHATKVTRNCALNTQLSTQRKSYGLNPLNNFIFKHKFYICVRISSKHLDADFCYFLASIAENECKKVGWKFIEISTWFKFILICLLLFLNKSDNSPNCVAIFALICKLNQTPKKVKKHLFVNFNC